MDGFGNYMCSAGGQRVLLLYMLLFTESQGGEGWKGPLEKTLSNLFKQAHQQLVAQDLV